MSNVVNNRASICQWELEFSFREKDQIRKFIKLLVDDDVDFDFECRKELDSTSEVYYINITGSWANNLVRVAKMADTVDYRNSLYGDYEE